MAGSVYTFRSPGSSPHNDGAIITSQGTVLLGQSGLFLASEVDAALGAGLDIVAGPASSPKSYLAAPTVAAGSAGLPNGVYRCVVTFVTAAGETKIGPEATVTVSSQQINWSNIPTAPASAGVTARNLYRTVAGGSAGAEKLVTTINDNSTTTYTDNVADGSLGVNVPSSDTSAVLTTGSPVSPQPQFATLTGNSSDDSFAIGAGTGTKISPGSGGSLASITDGTHTVNNPTSLAFTSGATVTNASGVAQVAVTGASGVWSEPGNVSGTVTVDFQNKVQSLAQRVTLIGTTTFLLENFVAGCRLQIDAFQDGTGSRVLQVNDGSGAVAVGISPTATQMTTVTCDCPDSSNVDVHLSGVSALSVTRTPVSVAYAATITPALPSGDAIFEVGTITGALAINAPSGTPFDGQMIQFRFTQDATGHAITFASGAGNYAFGTDVTAAMIPTSASAQFRMLFVYDGVSSLWKALAIVRGF